MWNWVKQAAIQTVATWPHEKLSPKCLRIANAVADLESPASYQEYLKGEFFAKNWILAGAEPSKIVLERPLIVLERDVVDLESPYSGKACPKLWITVIDTLCKECGETSDEATKRVVNTLHRFLVRFGKMKVWKNQEGVFKVAVEQPSGFILHKDRLLTDSPIQIVPNPRLVSDSGYAASVRVEYCECLPSETFVPFNHPLPGAESRCDTC